MEYTQRISFKGDKLENKWKTNDFSQYYIG
jgi:hypothetical protein